MQNLRRILGVLFILVGLVGGAGLALYVCVSGFHDIGHSFDTGSFITFVWGIIELLCLPEVVFTIVATPFVGIGSGLLAKNYIKDAYHWLRGFVSKS